MAGKNCDKKGTPPMKGKPMDMMPMAITKKKKGK